MSEEHHERLCEVVERLSKNNRRVQRKVAIELFKYKSSKPPTNSKVRMRLYYASIQKMKDDLTCDLCVQLINIRMVQFVRWFQYIMGKMPTLTIKTTNRLREKYGRLGFGRCVCVLLDKRDVEKERCRNLETKKTKKTKSRHFQPKHI